jgi:hypothetical protein
MLHVSFGVVVHVYWQIWNPLGVSWEVVCNALEGTSRRLLISFWNIYATIRNIVCSLNCLAGNALVSALSPVMIISLSAFQHALHAFTLQQTTFHNETWLLQPNNRCKVHIRLLSGRMDLVQGRIIELAAKFRVFQIWPGVQKRYLITKQGKSRHSIDYLCASARKSG